MSKYSKFLRDRSCVFTGSNNHQRNSMSSQSNRNWASTTPGKFLSSLLYLRSKPLVFLQALLNVQLLQNVWEGMRFGCLGLSVSEQVPDSPRPHKQHLANGHLKLSTLSASLGCGSVTQEGGEPLSSGSCKPSVVLTAHSWVLWSLSLCHSHQFWSPPVMHSGQNAFAWCISCWVWCSFAPRPVSRCSPVQRVIQPSRGKRDSKGVFLWVTDQVVIQKDA